MTGYPILCNSHYRGLAETGVPDSGGATMGVKFIQV